MIHPTFAAILTAHQHVPHAQLAAYRDLLGMHHWDYARSGDRSIWWQGSKERQELHYLRAELDPDYTIWNMYAPAEWRVELQQ